MHAESNPARRRDTRQRVKVARGVYMRSGRYIVQYTDSNGRSWLKTLGPEIKTKTDAIAARERMRVDVREGRDVAPSKVTVAEVAADFLATFESLVRAGEKSERTLELYRQRWRTHLEPRLGRAKMQALRPEHVARFLEDLRRAGLSSWTVTGVYTLLGSIIGHAMTRGVIRDDPRKRLATTERPKGRTQKRARALSNDECAKLIGAAAPGWRTLVATSIFTGLRLSEFLGLRWSDVDFGANVIEARHQLSVAKKGRPARLVPLKSEASERDVLLLPEIAALLRRHKLASAFSGDESFVFCTRNGKPLSQRNACRAFTKAAKSSGVSATSHILRHTAASRLIASGLDVVVVQRFVGHAKASTTLDIYSHEFQAAKRTEDIRAKIAATGIGAVLEAGAASC